jgi:Ca-activated chloride channel family protein
MKPVRQHRCQWALVTAIALAFVLTGCSSRPKNPTPVPGRVGVGAAFTGDGPSAKAEISEPTDSPRGVFRPGGEDLWVIARSGNEHGPSDAESPGTGALMMKPDAEEKEIPLPLKHTDVKASIDGCIATVDVTQQFDNPYDRKIEAVYVFPLPHNAAVSEFLMVIGERRIRGIIRERDEAEQIYREAKSHGYVASLLTEQRPNIFTQSVANLEPGRPIDVNIRYFHALSHVDGWYEFIFPMVVGPRFNPPGRAGGIGAVGRGQPGTSGQKTEVHDLRPGERSGHDISLTVDVNAGVSIEESACRTHAVSRASVAADHLVVALEPGDRIPNRDFVLRYRVAGERIKSSLLTHRDARGGYFSLMLYPPADLRELGRQALELVFVLDCSGSMSGRPLQQAKSAIDHALRQLRPADTFQLIRFSNDASALGPEPVPATPENVGRGLAYLRSLNSEGGTMMIEGIKAALDFPHDPLRLRFVCFLTDGYIGNEAEILREARQRLGHSRIFSFGVGSSVNRYLLDHLAKMGRGAVAYLGLKDDGAKVMDDFLERIRHPALTDLRIDWGGMKVSDVLSERLPDLFVGRPVVVTGRFDGSPTGPIRASGRASGRPVSFEVAAHPGDGDTHAALPRVWARMKIADLADRSTDESTGDAPAQIRQLALDYGLMSEFTAFVAVDSTQRTEGNAGTTVPVVVPAPDGVKYDTTVQTDR